MTTSNDRYEPLFDVHPVTDLSFEIFYADRTLESFGRVGTGWFWWPRRRGFAPDSTAQGPFPTSYSAYRNAMNNTASAACGRARSTSKVNTDTARTRPFSL